MKKVFGKQMQSVTGTSICKNVGTHLLQTFPGLFIRRGAVGNNADDGDV
jgi:hypothetical protein